MSEQTIWNALKKGGLSETSCAAMMGNMSAESSLESVRVQGDFQASRQTSQTYCANTDSGAYTKQQFCYDSRGWGLIQWTYWSRKQGLYEYAKATGKSIGDEEMQTEYVLKEIKEQYPNLFSYLCNSNDMYTATSRICTEFERPALNNVQARYAEAQKYYNKLKGTGATAGSTIQNGTTEDSGSLAEYMDYTQTLMPILKKGDKGLAVGMAQFCLQKKGLYSGSIDCDYGSIMFNALSLFKAKHGLDNTSGNRGIIDGKVWEKLYE